MPQIFVSWGLIAGCVALMVIHALIVADGNYRSHRRSAVASDLSLVLAVVSLVVATHYLFS